jgi:hypothetical protein
VQFPVHDWQFWVATAIVVLVVVRMAWMFVRKRRGGRGVSTTLTIEGEPTKGARK